MAFDWGSLLYYNTVKLVHIKSKKLGCLHYSIQALILIYVVIWVIVLQKGYQGTDAVVGSVSIKVKGSSYVIDSTGGVVVWDAIDTVKPPVENNAVFITTNYIYTPNQYRGICPGTNGTDTNCSAEKPCEPLESSESGITTGTCNTTTTTCDLYAWCPLEDDTTTDTTLLRGVQNSTIFARVDVKFPLFDESTTTANGTAPTEGYNLFTLDDVVTSCYVSGDSGPTYNFSDIAAKGAALAALVEYDCNLDYNISQCSPHISWVRLDNPNSFSKGFNYRYANYFKDDSGVLYRDLWKLMGARIVFLVSGQAGKFNVIPLFQNLGSGLALLAVATLVSDFIALHLLRNKNFYREVKYLDVADVDDQGENAALLGKSGNSDKNPTNATRYGGKNLA